MQTHKEAQLKVFAGEKAEKIPHWEHWSCPDGASYLAGIDYWEHPRKCMQKIAELYPMLGLGIPAKDDPIPRIDDQDNKGKGRWGAHYRDHWQQEDAARRFPDEESMLSFSPLEQGDFTGWNVVVDGDYSSEEVIYERLKTRYPEEWGDTAPEGELPMGWFYNTMFMWPLLVFGYEHFLSICLDPRFERIMDEFAEINRRLFRAYARLPIKYMVCHDDIVLSTGPVCSPEWMHKYIFPRYEEFWGILRDAGKEVIFMVDGCVDAFAEDVLALGARGIISEPFTDYKAIARRHEGEDLFLAGEGDNRILSRNDPEEIDAMVKSMLETAKMTNGYMFCIGNHIPFNVTPEGIKRYFDRCQEWG